MQMLRVNAKNIFEHRGGRRKFNQISSHENTLGFFIATFLALLSMLFSFTEKKVKSASTAREGQAANRHPSGYNCPHNSRGISTMQRSAPSDCSVGWSVFQRYGMASIPSHVQHFHIQRDQSSPLLLPKQKVSFCTKTIS